MSRRKQTKRIGDKFLGCGIRQLAVVTAMAGVMMVGSVAGAEEPSEVEVDFDEFETAEVDPVFFVDDMDRELMRIQQVSALEAMQDEDKSMVRAESADRLSTGVDEGLGYGFAGHASPDDIAALHYGDLLGAVLFSARVEQDQIEVLQDSLSDLPITSEAQEQIGQLLDQIEAPTEATIADWMELMYQVELGLEGDTERAHGYLMVGLYTNASIHTVAAGEAPVSTMGRHLVHLLREDAAFDGADEALADQLEAFNTELGSDSPDLAQLNRYAEEMLAVEEDR